MKKLLLVSSALCFLLSCGSSRKAVVTKQVVLDTITVSAKNNPYDIYQAARPRYWDIIHTKASLSFDLLERTVAGVEEIKLRPYFYAQDSLVLDAKSMKVSRVEILESPYISSPAFTQHDDKLVIRFTRQYRRQQELNLRITYLASPYAEPTGGSKAITDDRGVYFINTDNKIQGKPVQIWTQGETEANSHWLPTIDQPNERFTIQLSLTVPDSFVTLSNGRLTSQKKDKGGNLRTDTWETDMPIQTYAVMFAIGRFAIVKDKEWKGKEVSYYVEPEFAPYAKEMFKNTPEMVEYFSNITGVPYPWNKYSQIVVRDYVSGAMENTSATLFGEFINQTAREMKDKDYEDIVSHELFHQWFGDYVTAESWSNLTVNESFANYGEQLWRLHKYGPASNDELAYADLSKYLSSSDYNDEPLVRFHYEDKEDMFDRISYEKGGAVLNYIHGLVGDSAFFRAMNIYLTRNAFQPAEAHNWRIALEEATGQDWNWFFNQWYYRGGHPSLSFEYTYDDVNRKLDIQVKQKASDSGKAYTLPLKAALIYDGATEVFDWTVDSKKQSLSYPYKAGVKPVFIPDYAHWLPGTLSEKKKSAEWLRQLKASGDYINKRRAVAGAFANQQDTVSQELFHLALKDSLEGIRSYALQLLQRMPDKYKWREHFKNEVKMIALNGSANRERSNAFDVLAAWKTKDFIPEMIAALDDSSYMVAGSALEGLTKANKDTAYIFARRLVTNKPKGDLALAAWSSVADLAKPQDIGLFEKEAVYFYGSKKLALAGYLNTYLAEVKDLDAYDRALALLTNLAGNEGIKSYRYAIGYWVFNAVTNINTQIKSNTDKTKLPELEQRLAIAKKYRDQVLKEESDPENQENYKKQMGK